MTAFVIALNTPYFAQGSSEGKFSIDKVPAGIPHENIRFYQRHQAELQRVGEELRALEGKTPPEQEDSLSRR